MGEGEPGDTKIINVRFNGFDDGAILSNAASKDNRTLIAHNHFWESGGTNGQIDLNGAQADDCIIVDNVFRDGTVRPIFANVGDGIIAHNTFRDNTGTTPAVSVTSGWVVRANNADTSNSQTYDANQVDLVDVRGLTGATSASRYVGATASGAPASGTFAVGDFVVDHSGSAWVCTVAGSPGTWVELGGGGSSPLTTKGDLWGYSTVDARLPVGNNDEVLTADSGETLGVKWAAAAAATTGTTSSPLGARVHLTAAETITTSTFTALPWDAEARDDGGFWAVSPNPTRLTIPTGEDGWYDVIGNVRWAGDTTGDRYLEVYLNGTTKIGVSRVDALSSAVGQRQQVSSTHYLEADDYVELRAWHDKGSNLDIDSTDSESWFAIAPATRAGDTAASTIYVNGSTGSDTTGDGTSGTPYATIGKGLSDLPDSFGLDHTIDVANATYAEGIDITRFVTHGYLLKFVGDTTTPTNVLVTGSVSSIETYPQGTTITAVARVQGNTHVEFEGMTLRGNGTIQNGLFVHDGARVIFDRCQIDCSTGTFSGRAIRVQHNSTIEFAGNNTLEDWDTAGVAIFYGSHGGIINAGTLTITGPGTTGIGVHLLVSDFLTFGSQPTGIDIAITGVQFGFQLGFKSSFTHQASTGDIDIDNASKPTDSAAVQCTDLSSWSSSQPVTIDNFTDAFEANSISYIEATGTRTITNVTNTSDATQNSVIYLP
jgi:hypothetical protein